MDAPPPAGGQSDVNLTSRQPATKKGLLDWQLEGYYDRQLLLSRRAPSSVADLLQNCDLPPPINIFSPIHKPDAVAAAADEYIKSPAQSKEVPTMLKKDDNCEDGMSFGCSNMGLLRALQLSQTRAREAEKKASVSAAENEQMVWLLLKQSLRLSAHRQWVKMLEIEVSVLHKQKRAMVETNDDDDGSVGAWFCLAMAVCVGIAGLGFALGSCTFLSSHSFHGSASH